jgi:hypothetical protein
VTKKKSNTHAYKATFGDFLKHSTSFTSPSLVLGFKTLHNAKPIHTSPTIPPTTAMTYIPKAQDTTTNNAVPAPPAMIACLCCVVFVDGFSSSFTTFSFLRFYI